ncbi:MAG: sortase [Candidatus Levybacteria bacterium]|nr:sortase [Candidatus Levybacteria bacterium]
MAKYYYKGKKRNYRILFRLGGVGALITGAILFAYTFFPLFSWQIYFAPVFASQKIDAPIPTSSIINPANIGGLIASATNSLSRDYTNAYNWYPGAQEKASNIATYKISIPKINITDAKVSNEDNDLTRHMVQFNSDTLPGKDGNTIIFGHSTLPQLFDPKNYKTILANAYKVEVGDKIIVDMGNEKYNYKVESVTVVEPSDTSVLAQNFSDSFLTIITCTPPGTIWKRLIIKARIRNS